MTLDPDEPWWLPWLSLAVALLVGAYFAAPYVSELIGGHR